MGSIKHVKNWGGFHVSQDPSLQLREHVTPQEAAAGGRYPLKAMQKDIRRRQKGRQAADGVADRGYSQGVPQVYAGGTSV